MRYRIWVQLYCQIHTSYSEYQTASSVRAQQQNRHYYTARMKISSNIRLTQYCTIIITDSRLGLNIIGSPQCVGAVNRASLIRLATALRKFYGPDSIIQALGNCPVWSALPSRFAHPLPHPTGRWNIEPAVVPTPWLPRTLPVRRTPASNSRVRLADALLPPVRKTDCFDPPVDIGIRTVVGRTLNAAIGMDSGGGTHRSVRLACGLLTWCLANSVLGSGHFPTGRTRDVVLGRRWKGPFEAPMGIPSGSRLGSRGLGCFCRRRRGRNLGVLRGPGGGKMRRKVCDKMGIHRPWRISRQQFL